MCEYLHFIEELIIVAFKLLLFTIATVFAIITASIIAIIKPIVIAVLMLTSAFVDITIIIKDLIAIVDIAIIVMASFNYYFFISLNK